MKRLALLNLILGVTLFSAPALADQGQFYLAPGVQWMDFDNETGLDSDNGWFAGLGYQITERLAAEISSFDLDPDIKDGVGDMDIDHYKLDLLYDLHTDLGRFQPFVVGGIGNTKFGGDNETQFDFGAGIKIELSDNLVWRTAVRSYNFRGRGIGDGDIGVDSSLVFYFGGRGGSRPVARSEPTPAPARTPDPAPATPAPADADRDGVPDSRDACPDTPQNYAVDNRGCPIPVEEVARVELLVNFDFDRSEVKPEYFSEIEEVVDFMRQYPDVIAELEGHTDSIGTTEYNQGLSERRAQAVRQVMIDRFNIQGSRVSTRGFGESQPVASNDTATGREQNRRVITVIIRTQQNFQPR